MIPIIIDTRNRPFWVDMMNFFIVNSPAYKMMEMFLPSIMDKVIETKKEIEVNIRKVNEIIGV